MIEHISFTFENNILITNKRKNSVNNSLKKVMKLLFNNFLSLSQETSKGS